MGEQSVITYRRMIFRSWLCSNLLLSPSKVFNFALFKIIFKVHPVNLFSQMSNCGQLNKKPRIENYAQQLCGWFQKTTLDNNRLLFPLGTKLPCNIRGVSSTVGPVGIVRPVVQHMQWLYEYICTTSIQSQNEIAGLLVIGPPGCGKVPASTYF